MGGHIGKRHLVAAALAAWSLAACGGAPVETAAPATAADEAQGPAPGAGEAVQVEGLLGDIPQADVERVLARKNDAIAECYQLALDVNEQIEGSVELALEVGADGAVSAAHLRSGTLGSSVAERCIVELARRLVFPKPRGGARASIVYPLTLEEPYGHPDPVDWSGDVGTSVAAANSADVARCLNAASGVQLTVYVVSGGAVVSAGATSDSADAADAAACLAEAALQWRFPDPGRAVAKAIISF